MIFGKDDEKIKIEEYLFIIIFEILKFLIDVLKSPYLFFKIIESAKRTKFGKLHGIEVSRFTLALLIFLAVVILLLATVYKKTESHFYESFKMNVAEELAFRQKIVLKAEEVASTSPSYKVDKVKCENCYDCSSFVTEVFARLGKDIRKQVPTNGVKQIYVRLEGLVSFRKPEVGDIVFLDRTLKIIDDKTPTELTHCGIVEAVFNDGSFLMIHMSSEKNKIQRTHFNLTKDFVENFGKIRGFGFVDIKFM